MGVMNTVGTRKGREVDKVTGGVAWGGVDAVVRNNVCMDVSVSVRIGEGDGRCSMTLCMDGGRDDRSRVVRIGCDKDWWLYLVHGNGSGALKDWGKR